MDNVVIVCRQKKPGKKLLIRGCTASAGALLCSTKMRKAVSVRKPFKTALWGAGLAASCITAATCLVESGLKGRRISW